LQNFPHTTVCRAFRESAAANSLQPDNNSSQSASVGTVLPPTVPAARSTVSSTEKAALSNSENKGNNALFRRHANSDKVRSFSNELRSSSRVRISLIQDHVLSQRCCRTCSGAINQPGDKGVCYGSRRLRLCEVLQSYPPLTAEDGKAVPFPLYAVALRRPTG